MHRVVERRSVKGTPVLYLYNGQKYLGSLFFADVDSCTEFKILLGWHPAGATGEVVFERRVDWAEATS
jgi:hypothetical protein